MQYLHTDSTLQSGKYRIIGVLGQGGFGITYLAENVMLEGKVAIKEFFFKEFCNREADTSHVTVPTESNRELVDRFKKKFIKEARTIFKLNHPNIVRILDIFEENDTAYYVMDYIEGSSLGDIVNSRGSIPEAEAVGYIKTVASALQYIHGKNINHLDIKPGNIMKRSEDGSILVIDFGVAKQYDADTAESTTTTPVGISKGYSPLEQYTLAGVREFSPQSDVYSLAATLYKLLTGITPPEAATINDSGLPKQELQAKGVSPSVIKAIDAAMRSRSQRTQSIKAFVADLETTIAEDDDEKTRIEEEALRAEQERRRKEEQERKARAEAERKRKEEEERKQKEEERKKYAERKSLEAAAKVRAEEERKRKEKNEIWGWLLVALLVVVGVLLGMNGGCVTTTIEEPNDTIAENNADGLDSIITINANGVDFNMILVKAGTFTMGATPEQDSDAFEDESPAHPVTLTNDYYIGQTEVTQALWKAVMGDNPSQFEGDNLPVDCVELEDCQAFIENLNTLTGRTFRLPTEAEWEFAARGGNNSKGYKFSGSNNVNEVAWYSNEIHQTYYPVATKISNELGIYDMSGNVWEWCQDWLGNYSSSAETDPEGDNRGSVRGGGWHYEQFAARYCRVSQRWEGGGYPLEGPYYFGLRLVLIP